MNTDSDIIEYRYGAALKTVAPSERVLHFSHDPHNQNRHSDAEDVFAGCHSHPLPNRGHTTEFASNRDQEISDGCAAAQAYESIHKAVQYQNSGATQIGIMNGSDVITMDFKQDFQCLKRAAARKGTMRQTSLSNAEESEAAARRYCEGFTALLRVCDVPDVSSKFSKATRNYSQTIAVL